MDNPLDRDARVARDLLNAVPYRECAGGDYGDQEDDYSDDEHSEWDKDIYNYYESCETNTLTLRGGDSRE